MDLVEKPDGAVQNVVVVVPCYNEERRLRLPELGALERQPGIRVLFVDDGSTDATAELLRAHCEQSGGRSELMGLPENRGKAEAVRAGMVHALARGATILGYADSDLSTPVEEILRVLAALDRPGVSVAIGARVALLGTSIDRGLLRHYLGRVFATAASITLQLRVYDTQCGAKFFRATPALEASLAEPFSSRWAFDVELIGRLLTEGLEVSEFLEVPLQRWTHVGGSKLRPASMIRSGLELLLIGVRLRRRQARAALAPRSRPG